MSAASPATGAAFGEVYSSDITVATTTDQDARDSVIGLQRLNLIGPDSDSVAAKPLHRILSIPMPKLEGNTRRRPLRFTELPVDVLKEIIKEVTHTNDLTSLCLTCRCLHSLAIPQIYSRFDIVWPDATSTGERVGVDALTHGLATLTNSTKRGNDHARWVKKFSLGNGPAEWVSEYNISKEGGKMLGTLVNLAITRMENLEAFSWDMPTGILRDVFMSLHDLTESLKSLHVRFHDNRETTPPTSQDPSRRVESPTFKGFKGLRTLSVLDVDERQYLEEMSYAIEDSVGKLKELRLGIAEHHPRWIRDFDDPENQSSSGESQEGAFGGVLGVLFSRIINQEEGRRKRRGARADDLSIVGTSLANAAVETAEAVSMTSGPPSAVYVNPTDPANTTPAPDGSIPSTEQSLEHAPGLVPEEVPAISSASSGIVVIEGAPSLGGSFVDVSAPVPTPTPTTLTVTAPIVTPVTPAVLTRSFQRPYGPEMESKQLKLETLALERVPLSIPIMVHTNAIDWSCLSNLTILNCANHERLWKALRRKFSPHPAPTPSSILSTGINLKQGAQGNSPYRAKAPSHQSSTRDYKIRLKKIHTDGVTHTLIGFIKETLPPNSLEILFLQETMADTTVTMDTIYRGAIRPHKGSLKKLLINSKNHDETEGRFWTFGQEHLRFISGKMPKLRELGMALDHKDWHYFLTRLPRMQQLRSLYITSIRDSPLINLYAPRELASQLLSTVILRPEVELCYVGIMTKCYEILEGSSDESDLAEPETSASAPGGASAAVEQDSDDEAESDIDDEDEDEEEVVDEDEGDSDNETDYTDEEKQKPGIRLREILFYDDKVEIFRARNARL